MKQNEHSKIFVGNIDNFNIDNLWCILDILKLKSFYDSAIGQRVTNIIQAKLSFPLHQLGGERVVGIGYVTPYLDPIYKACERCFAFMPARQGAFVWPVNNIVATALVFEEDLPLPDASIDRIILVHSLEFAENAREMLNEIWRVLAPNGRITIVVPNRRGFWARNEQTPFGSGQPYSRGQLQHLLNDSHFTVENLQEVLHFSPSHRFFPRLLSKFYEPFARQFFPYFGGIIISVAQKRLYHGVAIKKRQSRRIFMPVLSPQTSQRLPYDAVKPLNLEQNIACVD